jgi:uncharacterized protein
MIRILAVSDDPCPYLEQVLESTLPADLPVDLLISCGDLDIDYLDYLSSLSNHILYYINGNHDYINGNHDYMDPKSEQAFGEDLHGRVEVTKQAILCGFAGALWYKKDEYQFRESQMRFITWKVRWQVWKIRLWEKLLRKPPKPLIVLSHAPVAGIHDQDKSEHQGFECFKNFIQATQPTLWLHGHVHLHNCNEIQKTQYLNTLIANVYQFKYIVIKRNDIQVGYVFPSASQ